MVDINRLYIVLILLLAGCAEQSPEDIAQGSLIVDTHIDTPYRIKAQLDNSGTYEDIAQKTSYDCLLYTSPSPRDGLLSRMPSSA